MKVNDIYWHYNRTGSVMWGMKQFTIIKIGKGCMCPSGEYVECESLDNNGHKYKKHIELTTFKKRYFTTEKEAWIDYKQILYKNIDQYRKTSNRLYNEIRKINEIVKEMK